MTTDMMAQPETVAASNPTDELLLIDLSSIAHPIWHMSQSEPDPNATCTKIVDRVRGLAARHPYAAICCDSGRSFRAEIDPNYKAQRPEQVATLHHQIRLAKEKLADDGFPMWSVRGYEADDLIASAVSKALAIDGASVLIASADKDLLQLVGERVKVISTNNGNQYDAEAVKAKFGIGPESMRDYLTLVGDASDNVIGAKGIGPKRACELLALFGSLDGLYAAIDKGDAKLTPAVAASLAEFRLRFLTVRQLITLRSDVEIPFEQIAAERTPKDMTPLVEDDMGATDAEVEGFAAVMHKASAPQPAPALQPEIVTAGQAPPVQTQALAVTDTPATAPAEWEKQLEPRSMREAQALAKHMHDARLFNGYGTPAAVLSTVLAGRELGLQAIASLRAIHIVEGRHMLAADLLRGLVLRSGLAKYFRCSERTPERATFITHRKDDPEPVALTYTIEEGRLAFGFDEAMSDKERAEKDGKWKRSGWGKNPADMLVARSGAKLARLVYPEVTHGLYCREEFDNGRD